MSNLFLFFYLDAKWVIHNTKHESKDDHFTHLGKTTLSLLQLSVFVSIGYNLVKVKITLFEFMR